MTFRDDLIAIQGIGPKNADKIIEFISTFDELLERYWNGRKGLTIDLREELGLDDTPVNNLYLWLQEKAEAKAREMKAPLPVLSSETNRGKKIAVRVENKVFDSIILEELEDGVEVQIQSLGGITKFVKKEDIVAGL